MMTFTFLYEHTFGHNLIDESPLLIFNILKELWTNQLPLSNEPIQVVLTLSFKVLLRYIHVLKFTNKFTSWNSSETCYVHFNPGMFANHQLNQVLHDSVNLRIILRIKIFQMSKIYS